MSDFKLARAASTSNYADVFNTPNGSVVPGDVIAYHITATDVSVAGNVGHPARPSASTASPSARRSVVLVLDDDETAKRVPETKVVNDTEGSGQGHDHDVR